MKLKNLFFFVLLTIAFCSISFAQSNPDWFTPLSPFRIAGNLYYVGSRDLASYLIVTPRGDILINNGYDANIPLIKASVEKLGFRFNDIKILLIGQAHSDHAGVSANIKKMTGAKYMVMQDDVSPVESGGRTDFYFKGNPSQYYQPAKVDQVLHDGDKVKLGGTILTAHLTPGHTRGCTTWTMQVYDHDKTYNAVIVGGVTMLPGVKLVHNPDYPRIAADYAHTWQVLKSLPCDIFLGAHGIYFNLLGKLPMMKQGGANPFIDPEGYKKFVAQYEHEYQEELARQQAAGRVHNN